MSSVIFQVRDWQRHYENDRSRRVTKCKFVCVPNKQHGWGFKRIMAEPDGAAIYGIFHIIVGTCSQQQVRDGWLTDSGEPMVSPWGAKDLAMRFGRPVEEVERALQVLTSDRVGWIIRHDDKCLCKLCLNSRQSHHNLTTDSPQANHKVTSGSPPVHHEVTLEQNRTEQKGREQAAIASPASHQQVTSNSPKDETTGTPVLDDVAEAKRRIGSMFARPDDSPWSHAEEAEVANLVRTRADWKEELAVIDCYRNTVKPEDLKFDFPRSVLRLLERWNDTLDTARTKDMPRKPAAPSAPAPKDWQNWRYPGLPGKIFSVTNPPKLEDFPDASSFETASILFEGWVEAGRPHRK